MRSRPNGDALDWTGETVSAIAGEKLAAETAAMIAIRSKGRTFNLLLEISPGRKVVVRLLPIAVLA